MRRSVCGRGATKRKFVLKRGEVKTRSKLIKTTDLGIFCISLTTIKIRFHHEHGGQPCWHLLRSIQHQASPGDFTIFELEFLQASNISCPLEMPRLFWPSDSGLAGTFTLPAACASAILRIIWNHADSWGAADDSTWLNPHIFNTCDQLPHVKSIRCIRFGLKVHSRCSGLIFFLHTQKEMGCHSMPKNQVSDCSWWVMTLVSLYQNGKHRMGITHTAVTAVSDSGSSKTLDQNVGQSEPPGSIHNNFSMATWPRSFRQHVEWTFRQHVERRKSVQTTHNKSNDGCWSALKDIASDYNLKFSGVSVHREAPLPNKIWFHLISKHLMQHSYWSVLWAENGFSPRLPDAHETEPDPLSHKPTRNGSMDKTRISIPLLHPIIISYPIPWYSINPHNPWLNLIPNLNKYHPMINPPTSHRFALDMFQLCLALDPGTGICFSNKIGFLEVGRKW